MKMEVGGGCTQETEKSSVENPLLFVDAAAGDEAISICHLIAIVISTLNSAPFSLPPSPHPSPLSPLPLCMCLCVPCVLCWVNAEKPLHINNLIFVDSCRSNKILIYIISFYAIIYTIVCFRQTLGWHANDMHMLYNYRY